jgi:hypothetical protein
MMENSQKESGLRASIHEAMGEAVDGTERAREANFNHD